VGVGVRLGVADGCKVGVIVFTTEAAGCAGLAASVGVQLDRKVARSKVARIR